MNAPTTTARAAALIEDVQWLLTTGEHPDQIVHRTGYRSRNSLHMALHRAGRGDLAAQITTRERTAP